MNRPEVRRDYSDRSFEWEFRSSSKVPSRVLASLLLACQAFQWCLPAFPALVHPVAHKAGMDRHNRFQALQHLVCHSYTTNPSEVVLRLVVVVTAARDLMEYQEAVAE